MNILQVTGMPFPTKYGGFEKWLVAICEKATQQGHHVYISYTQSTASVSEFNNALKSSGGEALVLRNDHEIELFCSEQNIKIVQFHFDFNGYKSLYRRLYRKGIALFASLHCENYYYTHTDWKKTPKSLFRITGHRIKTAFVSKYFYQIFGASQTVTNQYSKMYFWPQSKLSLLYLGINGSSIPKKALNSREVPVISCVAFHSPIKGVDVLLQAIAILKEQGIDVLCQQIGGGSSDLNGEDTQELRQLAKQLGIENSIVWVGVTNQVSHYLETADIYCQPSRTEALSLSIAEAMQYNLPIVASCVGGVPELVVDGENGFLVEPNNPASLAEKLKELILQPELREKMGQASANRLEQLSFSHEESIKKLWENYRKCLF